MVNKHRPLLLQKLPELSPQLGTHFHRLERQTLHLDPMQQGLPRQHGCFDLASCLDALLMAKHCGWGEVNAQTLDTRVTFYTLCQNTHNNTFKLGFTTALA